MSNACRELAKRTYFFMLCLHGRDQLCPLCHITNEPLDKIRIKVLELCEVFFMKLEGAEFSYSEGTTRIDFHPGVGKQTTYTAGEYIIGVIKIVNQASVVIQVK